MSIDPRVDIGHVHLKVADMERAKLVERGTHDELNICSPFRPSRD